MSINISSQVWKTGPSDRGEMLVLLALADHADKNGKCWPSMAAVAKKARIASVRATRRIVRRLEDACYVTRQVGGGRGKSSVYIVNPDPKNRDLESGIDKPGIAKAPNPDPSNTKPGRRRPPEPSVSTKEPSDTQSGGLENEFEAFWAEAPRKAAKSKARQAYAKARKEVTAETLIGAMKAYARTQATTDPQYIAYPATWLNQGRWTDELSVPASDFHDKFDRMLSNADRNNAFLS